jgi:hypothetical protein
MSIVDNLRGLLGGSGRTTVPVDPLPGEKEIRRFYACRAPGSLRSVGGELVVTNQRIYFTPWNTKDLSAIEGWLMPKMGLPRVTKPLILGAQRMIDDAAGDFDADGVVVTATGNASLLRAPAVRIEARGAPAVEFGILKSVSSPNISKANELERDEFVALIKTGHG